MSVLSGPFGSIVMLAAVAAIYVIARIVIFFRQEDRSSWVAEGHRYSRQESWAVRIMFVGFAILVLGALIRGLIAAKKEQSESRHRQNLSLA